MVPPTALDILSQEKGGFDFSLSLRNANVGEENARKLPKARKTGTTICGVVYNDGVVIAADTRATSGSIVCDKNCEKIHYISKLIWCCGAGTSADTENTTALIASKMKLLQLATNQEPRVVAAMTQLKQYLFGYQGYISAALVLGGVDTTGSYLYTVHPHGSVDRLPFVSMGSGSLAAMAVLEAGYSDDLTEQQAIELVSNAIQAGIFNDLGSGSNVDVCVVSNSRMQATMKRTHLSPIEPISRVHTGYNFPRSTTEYVREVQRTFHNSISVTTVAQISPTSNRVMTD